MKQHLFFFLLIVSAISTAQTNFDPGYIVDNSGNRKEVQILNLDWRDNPNQIRYQASAGAPITTSTINDIQEFAVEGGAKYIRVNTKIDRSSDIVANLSESKGPDLQDETLFLQVLLEGEASLYRYKDGNLSRFFFKVGDGQIEQLVYKRYKIKYTKIAENVFYKQQLAISMRCDGLTTQDATGTSYRTRSLLKYFVDYNTCKNSRFNQITETGQKNSFHLSLRPGINFSQLAVDYRIRTNRDITFDRTAGVRFGAEAEFILPFNNDKWVIIIEPTYQAYTGKGETTFSGESSVTYNSLEVPMGIRHYFFFGENSSLFINAQICLDFPLKTSFEFENATSTFEIDSQANLIGGIGLRYKRTSLELRYTADREVLNGMAAYTSKFNAYGIVLGYQFF